MSAAGNIRTARQEALEKIKEKHIELAGWMERLRLIRRELLIHFHSEKYDIRNPDLDPIVKTVYDELFFLGQDCLSMDDIYPSMFKATLEEAMLDEYWLRTGKKNWPSNDDGCDVYRNTSSKEHALAKQLAEHIKVNLDDWKLSDGPGLTSDDVATIKTYAIQFINMLKYLTNAMFVRDSRGDRYFSEDEGRSFLTCEAERIRITDCIDRAVDAMSQVSDVPMDE